MTAKHGDVWRSPCGAIELRCGPWQEALADVERVDAVITDPPYSARVHSGQRTGSRPRGGGGRKTTLIYDGIVEADALELAAAWAPRTSWWAVVFSDHTAQSWHEGAWEKSGFYTFAPVVWLRMHATPRLSGDGPTSACDYITVARPRHAVRGERAGSRPGYYLTPGNDGRDNTHPGGKPMVAMRAIVRDYSRPGDLVCDPCAGGATTLLAAAIEGRRAIGAELDPVTFTKAVKRLENGWTVDMFSGAERTKPVQEGLMFGGDDAAQ